tara:strand:- start:7 stop:570 length:564 start_codon:yes stop_codon:yes gene_type:complete
MEETLQNTQYKLICSKNNIILQKDTSKKYSFIISFCTKPAGNVFNLLKSQNLYYLLGKLNPDIIETIDIIGGDKNHQNIMLVFNRFGKEIGLSQKYLFLKTRVVDMNSSALITKAHSVAHENPPDKCTYILADYANFLIKKIGEHMIVEYTFSLDLREDLPIYMKNLPGLLMKKVFIRVKNYIENGR